MTLCVYALVSGPVPRVPGSGIGGERLHPLTQGTVTAIAGQLRRPPAASPAALRRYDEVVRALASHFPAVLPARFATCFVNAEELASVLRARQASLRRALTHVRNRVQVTVRIVGAGAGKASKAGKVGEAVGAGRVGKAGRVGRGGPGTDYLRQRAEAAARAREVPGFEPVRTAVRRWVRDERVEKHAAVATVYHLSPRASVLAYTRRLRLAADAAGLTVVVSGPWPAYAFAGWE